MSSYQNKSKEELIIELEKLQQLNNLLVSSHKKKEKKYDKEVQKLHKKDLLFRKLSANVSDLIFQFTRRTDGSYFVPIASEGIKNIFGCSPEDVLNDFTPIANVIYPEDAERVMNDIEYSAKYLTYFNCEYRVQLPGKEIQWISSKSTPEKLPDGSVTWYGFNANITERKKAEEKLKEAMLLLQSSIESPKDMIILSIDKNYNYLYFNECHRITMLYAYGQEVKIGMNLLECITSEEDKIKAKINYDKALNGESHITIEEYGDIEKSYYETRYNPIFNDKNEIIGTTAFSADVTERKKTEEQLFKSKEKVEESEARYRTLFENMNTGFVLFEVVENEKGIPIDLIILAANEGFEKTTGLNLKDAAGMNLTKVLPGIEKDEADWIGTYSKVANTGESAQFEQGSELLGYYYSISAFYAGPKQCAVTFQDITERKQEQQLMQEREYLLSSSQRAANVGSWSWKVGDATTYWSDETYRIYGLSPEMGAPSSEFFFEIIHPEDRPKMQEWPTLLIAGLHPPPIEFRVLKPDGIYRVIQTNGDVIETVDGVPTRIAGTAYDITERKQAEEKLRESEYRFRKLYEDGANGMVMVSKDFKFLSANRSFCQMVGYQEEELKQLTFLDITHPDDKDKDISQVKKMIAGEIDVFRTEKRYLNKNGQTIWAQLTLSTFYDSNDQFLYNLAIIINITDRKNAELDLIRMSRIMKNSQEIAHLGSFEYVAADQTTIWSEEEYNIYGLDPNGPSPEYNVMLEKCIHPDDAKLLHDTFMTAMQNQEVYELEHRIVRPDGSVRWVYDQANPYFDEQGNLLRYVGATLDITERKLLLEELEILNAELEFKVKQRTAQLEASNKELEAFSYSVSHDLRAPLRHINGYVDLLNSRFKDELPEKAHHYLKTISEASSQMGILIDELLKYSRTGQKEVSKSALDFNLLLKEVLEEMAPVTEGRNITWNIKELPKVFGDYKLMKLVWVNLLDNAIKYTRNQQTAKISVGYKKEAKDFVFWVCDNGVGFDMKYAHKLFGVFQRLHSQTEFEGTGIGLANVQRIIHKHLGRVWAEAEPGKGAKFYFSLPINLRKIR